MEDQDEVGVWEEGVDEQKPHGCVLLLWLSASWVDMDYLGSKCWETGMMSEASLSNDLIMTDVTATAGNADRSAWAESM